VQRDRAGRIRGVPYVDPGELLDSGSLIAKVPTSWYNLTSLRDAMIASIALSIQTSATGKNCFNVTYEVEELKRRDGLLGWVDEASNNDQFLCEFIDMLVDGLTVLAPEFAVEDVELEEGIDTMCCLADGG
jgi:flagellar motor component MotA